MLVGRHNTLSRIIRRRRRRRRRQQGRRRRRIYSTQAQCTKRALSATARSWYRNRDREGETKFTQQNAVNI